MQKTSVDRPCCGFRPVVRSLDGYFSVAADARAMIHLEHHFIFVLSLLRLSVMTFSGICFTD